MNKNTDSEIFELLFQVSKNIREKALYFNETANITIPQFLALSFIAKKKSVHMKEIAEHFSIEMSTSTSLLNKLAKLSLIKRAEGKTDRRIVQITLSNKGKLLVEKAKKIQEKNTKKMLSYLSLEQKNNLGNILKTLIEKA